MKIVHFSDVHWRSLARHKEYTRAFKIFFSDIKEIKPDLIVNTGDTYHLKTANLSPEVYEKLAWMFNELASIAPSITLLGNHDGNLSNKDRQDAISPIHEAIGNPNSYLLKKSETKQFEINGQKLAIHPFSVFDKQNWDKLIPFDEHINIGLFHGSISGCKTDTGWHLNHGEQDISYFKKFDYVLLGDIHKQQFLDYRLDKNNVLKPWLGYPGSMIQQNYGEEIKKGYLVWDIRGKNDWDVEWKRLINLAPFVTLPWGGSVEKTFKAFEDLHGQYAYMPGTRYRISSNVLIPQVQTKQLITELKTDRKALEVVFKTDLVSNMESVNAHGVKINKKSLAKDPETIIKLYEKYIQAHKDMFPFGQEEVTDAGHIIKDYVHALSVKNQDNSEARNVQWSIKDFKFNNIFGYGEDNSINFENLHNIVGIFGPNRIGKSSIVGGIMYTLFNTTDRGSIKNALIINKNKKECSGMIRVSINEVDYIIERRSVRSSAKKNVTTDEDKSTTTVNLWLVENRGGVEVKVSKNGITRDDTDKAIRNLIGTADDFLLTAFASQNNLHKFIDNKATKRKEILNRFLELDVFDNLFDYAKNDYTKLDSQNKNYSTKDWIRLTEKLEKEIEKYQKDVANVDERLVNLNEKRDQLKLWIKTHENDVSSIDLNTVANLEKEIKKLENDLTSTEERIKSNKAKLAQKYRDKSFLEKSLEKIDIKELEVEETIFLDLKQKTEFLHKSFEAESVTLQSQQKAVVKLKMVPCGNKFPDCFYIKDAYKAKETIGDQTVLVKDLLKSFKDNQKMLDRYVAKKLRQKISEHADMTVSLIMKDSEITNLNDKLEHDHKNLENIQKDLKSAGANLKNLKKSISMVESEEFQKKKQQLDSIQSELTSFGSKKNEALIGLGGRKDALSNLMAEQSQGKDLIRKLKLYDSIQTAFSKNGIPVMVLKSQLPDINREMSRVLDGLIDFSVTLETDTTANIMDVFLEDSNNKRPIELCSGMEKTICSMALRVALGNLSSLPRPDIFILDESFGSLDEENMIKGMELLSLFRDYFKSVLVISHEPQIKEVADMLIEIKNNGTDSRIEA